MKKILFFILLTASLSAFSQDKNEKPADKIRAFVSIGQFPASLATPRFSPLRLGIHAGVSRRWNNHPKHQFSQSANVGYFHHRDLQSAIQAYTEAAYTANFGKGLKITPLAIGGGYTLSISDMTTLEWDPATETYEVDKFPVRHNWMISLGASLSYETKLMIFADRKTSFFLDYRLQVQGVIVQDNIPVIAYSPVKVGISIPIGGGEE